MALVFIDRTCHGLSYRVIGRSKCELSQTKKYLRHSEMK